MALTYNYFNEQSGPDVMHLLLLEFSHADTICIEYSQKTKLPNISQLRSAHINGLLFQSKSDEAIREQLVSLAIMTERDVDVYTFDPTNESISQVQP